MAGMLKAHEYSILFQLKMLSLPMENIFYGKEGEGDVVL